jgi:hypothetical protein
MVLARVIVPSQAKVTLPPPLMAVRSAVSVQLVTTPPAKAVGELSRAKQMTAENKRAEGVDFTFLSSKHKLI